MLACSHGSRCNWRQARARVLRFASSRASGRAWAARVGDDVDGGRRPGACVVGRAAGYAVLGAGVSQARVSDRQRPMAARRRAAGRACSAARRRRCLWVTTASQCRTRPLDGATARPSPRRCRYSSSQQPATSSPQPARSALALCCQAPHRPQRPRLRPRVHHRRSAGEAARWPRRAGGPRATGQRAAGGCRKPSSFKCMRRFAELARWPMEPLSLGLSHACRVHEPRLPSPHAPSPALWPNCLSDRPFLRSRIHFILLECLPCPQKTFPHSRLPLFHPHLLSFTPRAASLVPFACWHVLADSPSASVSPHLVSCESIVSLGSLTSSGLRHGASTLASSCLASSSCHAEHPSRPRLHVHSLSHVVRLLGPPSSIPSLKLPQIPVTLPTFFISRHAALVGQAFVNFLQR
jgi:hypothetical protein